MTTEVVAKVTNRKFSETDTTFIEACAAVGLPNHKNVVRIKGSTSTKGAGVTTLTRQASKWRLKKGLAWKTKHIG